MRFDPSIEGELVDHYSELTRRKRFLTDDTKVRFVIWMIAPDSPYYDEKDFEVRLECALQEVGQDIGGELYNLWMQGDEELLEIMFQLFRLYADVDYETWFSMRLSFHITTAKLRDIYGLKDTDRSRAMKEVEDIKKKLLIVEYKLFNEDHIKNKILDKAGESSLIGYAEMYAQEPEIS